MVLVMIVLNDISEKYSPLVFYVVLLYFISESLPCKTSAGGNAFFFSAFARTK